jgi:hypothetical protein
MGRPIFTALNRVIDRPQVAELRAEIFQLI